MQPDHTRLKKLVAAAILAPSSHNTQPWIFRIGDDFIRLCADRARALPVNDPDDRELAISCGCALFNLRTAAAGQDMGLGISLAPNAADPDLLAEAHVGEEAEGGLASLAPLVGLRRTYRKSFGARRVALPVVDALRAAAEAEGAWFETLSDDDRRHGAAELVAEGDKAQWADPAWRKELAAWMHPRRRGDGLALPWFAVPVAKMAVRTFDMGNRIAASDRARAMAAPVLAVVGTAQDDLPARLKSGQALQRVLLVAVRNGLQAAYLNQPVQVPRLRPELQSLCGRPGFPQVLIRVGYPKGNVPASPRRRLMDVLEY